MQHTVLCDSAQWNRSPGFPDFRKLRNGSWSFFISLSSVWCHGPALRLLRFEELLVAMSEVPCNLEFNFFNEEDRQQLSIPLSSFQFVQHKKHLHFLRFSQIKTSLPPVTSSEVKTCVFQAFRRVRWSQDRANGSMRSLLPSQRAVGQDGYRQRAEVFPLEFLNDLGAREFTRVRSVPESLWILHVPEETSPANRTKSTAERSLCTAVWFCSRVTHWSPQRFFRESLLD